jgi:DNA-binding MarR family transcriptional regulator
VVEQMDRAPHGPRTVDGATVAPPAVDAPSEPSASEAHWLTAEQQEAWVSATALFLVLPGVLDAQLQRDAGLNLFEYLVLSQLSMAEHRSLRMSELSALTNGSLSRLSNVVKRLEQRGWVVRSADPVNGRYTRAVLTDSGWDEVVRAAPGHVEAVRQFVIEPLTAAQLRTLASIGGRILRRVETDGRCAPPIECAPPTG